MDMQLAAALDLTMFDYLHRYCVYFANYFQSLNPEWTRVIMRRGTFYDTLIHSFCIKKVEGKTLFADARGITDDPETFFSDFACSASMHVNEYAEALPITGEYENPDEDKKIIEGCKEVYNYIFSENSEHLL